jgi:hypothetical protein
MPAESPSLAEGLMEMVDNLSAIVIACGGYRAKCEEAGFSSESAEGMAVALHTHLLITAFKPNNG